MAFHELSLAVRIQFCLSSGLKQKFRNLLETYTFVWSPKQVQKYAKRNGIGAENPPN